MSQRRGLARWQVATLSAAGAAGSLALANWLAHMGVREPGRALAGTDALYPWTEGSVHYTAHGRGEPLLLLHDLRPGSSAYEYRHVFGPLAERYRVFAPDLLGYGLSGRPATSYTSALYVELIEDFMRQVLGATDQPAHVIAAGYSAPFAVLAAVARPQMFRSLTLIEPTGLDAEAPARNPIVARMTRLLLRAPLLGESVYNVAVSRPALRLALRRRLAEGTARVSDDVVDEYYSVAHQTGARFAPADTLTGALDSMTHTVSEAYASVSAPVLLLWGQRDPARPVSEGRELREAHPGAELRIFPTGAMPHVEAPEIFTREVFAWLRAAARV